MSDWILKRKYYYYIIIISLINPLLTILLHSLVTNKNKLTYWLTCTLQRHLSNWIELFSMDLCVSSNKCFLRGAGDVSYNEPCCWSHHFLGQPTLCFLSSCIRFSEIWYLSISLLPSSRSASLQLRIQERKSGHSPFSLAIYFGPSNKEINVRYWETY